MGFIIIIASVPLSVVPLTHRFLHSLSLSHSSHGPPLRAMPAAAVPADVIRRIADQLAADGSCQQTLASLQAASKLTYDVVNPILYTRLVVSATRCTSLLQSLVASDMSGFRGFDDDGQCSGDWRPTSTALLRRLASLSHVKHIVVRSLPPDHVSASFASAAAHGAAHGVYLLPRVTTVSLLPTAVDQLRTWTPSTYERPHNPPFLEALASAAQPTHLCLAFRLVRSTLWDEHRDLTTAGQYAFVRKVALMCEGWTALETVTYHDLVHQVPPSVPSTRNVYEFAPHVVPHPLFRQRYRFLRGREAVRLPGPEWNIRPWQMGIAIKNLFPSGSDHATTLQGTSWAFCGLAGHLLTKEARDDDDGTGVWWAEVDEMVQDSVRVGLARDLPAREGVGTRMVDGVFERVSYERATECPACHRELGVVRRRQLTLRRRRRVPSARARRTIQPVGLVVLKNPCCCILTTMPLLHPLQSCGLLRSLLLKDGYVDCCLVRGSNTVLPRVTRRPHLAAFDDNSLDLGRTKVDIKLADRVAARCQSIQPVLAHMVRSDLERGQVGDNLVVHTGTLNGSREVIAAREVDEHLSNRREDARSSRAAQDGAQGAIALVHDGRRGRGQGTLARCRVVVRRGRQAKGVRRAGDGKVVLLVVEDDARLGGHDVAAPDEVDSRGHTGRAAPLVDHRRVGGAVVLGCVRLEAIVRGLMGAVLGRVSAVTLATEVNQAAHCDQCALLVGPLLGVKVGETSNILCKRRVCDL